MTTRKPQPPPNADDPEQSRRFIDMAREVEASETSRELDKVLKRVGSTKPWLDPKLIKRNEPGD